MYLAQWFAAHARLRPQAPAIIDRSAGVTISYGALQTRILRRAAALRCLGVQQGDRVAVLSANCVEMLEVLFACARVGSVFAPLNFRLTAEEQAAILRDCAPSIVFEEPGRVAPTPVRRLNLMQPVDDEAADQVYALTEEAAQPLPTPDLPLMILYTGGTTGVPKGALLTQSTVQHNAWNTIAGWGLSPQDIAPVFTPFFHTGGLNVLLTPLLCLGGCVVLPATPNFDPGEALALIEETRATQVFMVPTMYTMLVEHPRFDAHRLRSVQGFISGGAPCPRSLFEAYWSRGLALRQGYGLTEAGPNTFGCSLEEAQRRPGTVGTPLPHVQLRLVREDGCDVAPGEVGEVVIAGPHVMPGYYQRPRETAEAIREGWLYTGDLAVCDADGYYTICGRRKEMFISGGENVFPAEVEEALASHPAVAEVAVVGVPHERWGEVGHAWVVLREGHEADAAILLEHCRARVARYKAPHAFHRVEALPKSAAGKVLKRMLAEGVKASAQVHSLVSEPATSQGSTPTTALASV